MSLDITIATTQTNRKELAEAFGPNQSAVRRLENLTTDVRKNLPDGVGQAYDVAQQALTIAQALQQIAFVVAAASADAPNADVLTQGEGIKITIAAGEITVSLVVPVAVTDGGTGVTTLTPHGVLLGNGGGPVHITSAGTAGQMLISAGASTDPAFSNSPKITGGTIDGADVGNTTPAKGAFTQLKNGETVLMHSTATLANGAGSAAGTLTNAPVAGNPTKWLPVDDNGTTRYVPAW